MKGLQAQGIERESIAGQASAESASGTDADNQPYNLRVGPVTLRTDAGVSGSFNDNINLGDHDRLSDFSFAPFADVHGLWQVTELNALNFDLGVGYQAYLQHSEYDSFLVSPDSRAQFNVFIGDFKLNFHEALSFQNDPIQVGQLSNTAQFSRLTNDAGLEVDWDLGDVVPALLYDHQSFWVTQSQYKYLDYQSDTITPQFTYNVSKTIQAGLKVSFSQMDYEQHVENDNVGVTGGPFATAQITNNLSATAQAGWTYLSYSRGGSNGDNENADSYYGSLGINHRINDNISETLSAGHEIIPGITSNYTERTYVNYSPSVRLTDFISIVPDLWYEHLNDSQASVRETADRFGAGFNVGYSVTDHLSLNFAYQYVLKNSDPTYLDYYQDLAVFSVRYAF